MLSHSSPTDKREKVDVAGHKFYSTGVLGIKGMSCIACMSRYTYAVWEQMPKVLDTIPQNKCVKWRFLQKGGMLFSKQLLNSAKHILDLFAKTLTSAVFLRRHAWLHFTDLQHVTRAVIEDLPFRDEGLFGTTTDTVLQYMDKSLTYPQYLLLQESLSEILVQVLVSLPIFQDIPRPTLAF